MNNPNLLLDKDKVEELMSWLEKTEDKELIEEIIVKSIDKINKGIKEKEYKEIIDKNIGRTTKEKETEFLKKLLYVYKKQESRYDTIQLICRLLYLDPSDLSLLYDLSVELFNIKEFEKNKIIELLEGYRNKILSIKIKNALLNEIEILQRKYILKSKPRNLVVVLTMNCNLDCIMCFNKKEYSIDDKILNYIKNNLVYLEHILLQGGELYLYKDLEKLMLLIKNSNIKQSILTNGILLDRKKIKFLKDNKIGLNISIDAVSKKKYEYIRKNASFDKLLENLKMVRESGFIDLDVEYSMAVVVMSINYNDIEEIVNFAINNKFKSIYFQRYNRGTDINSSVDLSLNPKQQMIVNRKILNLKNTNITLKVSTNFDLITNTYNTALDNNLEKRKDSKFKDNKEKSICNNKTCQNMRLVLNGVDKNLFCVAPWKTLFIDANEEYKFSCYCSPFRFSFDEKNNDIWNSQEIVGYRKSIINNNLYNCCKERCFPKNDSCLQIRRFGF